MTSARGEAGAELGQDVAAQKEVRALLFREADGRQRTPSKPT